MLGQTPKVDPAGLQAHDRFDEVFERTTQAIEPPNHNRITRTRKVEHRLKVGTIIPHSTHHISIGSFDGGFRQRVFLERGGLPTLGDAHLSNLHSTISSHSFFSIWFWFDCTETHGNGNYSDVILQNGLSEWISLEK